ncbi:MAG TPA: 4-(cytidine 5'-diphospho)-2-C-methyl-D-erythritol kinase [Candidatus Omnitrophota bacterium]|nr:4-(cytidine 5'-diphospho)-2-C-methyl-D-erythritol kinase [Candidatus Omnitrophota bacterium]HSA30704.1 4-(cytidine 5'-diphospho)-2-C-methyl-D-erythritol kinase [Candidatus Omnitrophota bacterium]
MNALQLYSPAKVNLILKVINRRADGFHNIHTLFERISLCDQMHFRILPSQEIRILCDHPGVPCTSQNLVHKAASLLQQYCGVTKGVEVRIKKNIPVAAGLAGGSSNAATTLFALNRLWNLRLSRKQLLDCAARIGSDVPFFIWDVNWAIGERRGERIRPVSLRQKIWHVLVVPKIKMPTPKVYGALNLEVTSISVFNRNSGSVYGKKRHFRAGTAKKIERLTKTSDNANILIHSLLEKDINKSRDLLSNDLEQGIISVCPRLADIKERLKALGLQGVSFSGSGPSLFGLMASKAEAEKWRSILSKYYSQVFAVRTL